MSISSAPSFTSLWPSSTVQNAEEANDSSSVSLLSSSVQSTADSVNWMITNRGGMAFITGLVMVPSQFLSPRAETSGEIIDQAIQETNRTGTALQKFSLPVDRDTSLCGVIYWPHGETEVRSQCVLYHNPNGCVLANYFQSGNFSWTPSEIQQIAKCPVILYDYRGTGLSSENTSCSSSRFRPTYASIAQDGEAALGFALRNFEKVIVAGSSLGGGVATVALERCLEKEGTGLIGRVSLINHDSFSTTAQVVLPAWPTVARWAGSAVGGLLDAASSMESLINRKVVPIVVLCHTQDEVIPKGARMAEHIDFLQLSGRSHPAVYKSDHLSRSMVHATLSEDMRNTLQRSKAYWRP